MLASPRSPPSSSRGGCGGGIVVAAEARPSSFPDVVVNPRDRLVDERDDGDGDDAKYDVDGDEEEEEDDDTDAGGDDDDDDDGTRRRLVVCKADIVLPFSEDLAFEYFSDLTRQP
jgi:hypothetical protein